MKLKKVCFQIKLVTHISLIKLELIGAAGKQGVLLWVMLLIKSNWAYLEAFTVLGTAPFDVGGVFHLVPLV